jgi:CheY-like chemotaxis protein
MTPSPNVLIIEDDPATLGLLQEFLTDEGLTTFGTTDPTMGLAQLQTAPPALLLLDLKLPQLSGLDVLDQVRTAPSTAALPIILMSASLNLLASQKPDLSDPRTILLQKPIDLDDLLVAIKRFINVPLDNR